MADLKVSQLGAAPALTGAELLDLAVTNAANYKLPIASLLSVMQPSVFLVGPNGCPYTTVAAALTAIAALGTPPSLTSPAFIFVMPGTYTTNAPMVIPQYVSVIGLAKNTWPSARFINDTTDVFQPAGFNTFQNLTTRQGATINTFFVNGADHTDISVYGCAQFGLSAGQNQGFYRASGSNFARITIQDCIVNSYQAGSVLTPGTVNVGDHPQAVVLLENTSAGARFCDAWIKNCFFDMYQLGVGANNFGFAVIGVGVQDVRIEAGCCFRGVSPAFVGVYLAKGSTGGVPQIDIRHLYTGGNSIGVSPEAGCTINLLNSDCAGSIGAGTILNHNSYIGASYNSFPI